MARHSHPLGRSPRSPNSRSPHKKIDQLIQRAIEQHQSGSPAEAERLYRRALKSDPKHAEGRRLLAMALRDQGREEEAWKLIDGLAEQSPQNAQLQQMSAELSLRAGRPEQALHALSRSPIRSSDVQSIALYARAECGLGKPRAAEARLREALAAKPGNPTLQFNLAKVLDEVGRKAEAAALFQKLGTAADQQLRLAGRSHAAAALAELGRHRQALDELGRVLSALPQSTPLLRNRAVFLRDLGRVDEAVEVLRRAKALAPDDGETRKQLAWTRNHRDASWDDEEILWWEQAVQEPGRFGLSAQDAGFAWARILGQLNRREDELVWLLRANRAQRKATPFDVGAMQARHASIRAAYGSELFEQPSEGLSDRTPVFIVGLPRSGSTLVEQILASHSSVYGARELPDLDRVLHDRELLPDGDPLRIQELGGEALQQVAESYLQALRDRSVDAERVVDKMPQNYEHAGAILRLFPNARIIHVHRDPRDCAASILRHQFSGEYPYAYDARDLLAQFHEYQALCDHWREVLPAENFLEVRYESVVDDLESEARRLIRFVGLEWEDRCLEFHRTDRVVSTLSLEQVRRPIFRSSIGSFDAYRDLLGLTLGGFTDMAEGRATGSAVCG